MTRMVVVVGDPTTGGGTVITGSPFTDIDGKPVARIGDKATCPKCKGTFPIVSGDATFVIDGQPVARERDYLACGCRLMSGRQFRVFLDDMTSDSSAADAAMLGRTAAASTTQATTDEYDEAFVLRSQETGEPFADRRYRIVRESGSVEEGITDARGLTHVVKAGTTETLHIEVAEEEPA